MIYNTNLLISKYDCASLNLFYLRDFYLDFFDTEFGDALREIEVSVYVRFDPADRPYKLESNAWLDSRKLNKPKVRFLASSRKLKVQYITSIKGSENEFPIVGTIRKDEDETISPENFSDYCLEFLDILLQNLPKALKQNESFNAENFMEHLKS
ncbi:MAG: hypothetical protein C0507_03880, partial [Cyanobacteria bacterium PR.3.49]|nr:hypothetical protein [Cyanobacteria bacterium PR.3.49]